MRPDIYAELDQLRLSVIDLRDQVNAVATSTRTKTWYTRSEAAEYLTISTTKLDDLRGAGRLQTHYIDAKPVFHIDDLDGLAEPDPGTLADQLSVKPRTYRREGTEGPQETGTLVPFAEETADTTA